MDKMSTVIDRVAAPPLAPADAPIDRTHLTRMTLGDASLEREVLALFDRQAVMLLQRMQGAAPAVVAALAHTIKGSARGIGAFGVASAAEALELAADGRRPDLSAEVGLLDRAIADVRAVIADFLRAH